MKCISADGICGILDAAKAAQTQLARVNLSAASKTRNVAGKCARVAVHAPQVPDHAFDVVITSQVEATDERVAVAWIVRG
jgi:hypothetical protein